VIAHAVTLTIHALRVRRSTLIGWTASLALTMVAFMAMFPSIAEMDFAKIAQQYPEGLLKAFGIESIEQLSTAGGFLNLELFGALLPLALIFLPIGMVAHAIAANEERGYLVPLLALPLSRRSVMAGAAASAVIAQLIAIVAIVVSAMVASLVVGAGLNFGDILESSLGTLPLGTLAAGVAVVVAGVTARRGLATSIAAATIFAMYLIEVLSSFSGLFHDIRWISVFNYYSKWLTDGIAWPEFTAILGVSVLLMVVGGGLFARRDVS
jgi:ABC-2 type transport system permease protein